MKELRAFAYGIGRAIGLLALAVWFMASCAGAYVALWFFWPFLSVIFVVVWAVCRVAGLAQREAIGMTLERRSWNWRQIRVGGSDRPLGMRVLAAENGSFSVELARPRWFEIAHAVIWAPFFLQGPVLIALPLLQLAGHEEPRIVVDWSWLAIGAMLLAAFVCTAVVFAMYTARHFVEPATIGRRLPIPLTGYALCAAHRDVCAIEIQQIAQMPDRSSWHVIRFIRSGGEPRDLTIGARVPPTAAPPDELTALAKVLAQAARVPLRVPSGDAAEMGTRVSTT